jgi:hypothetical protein
MQKKRKEKWHPNSMWGKLQLLTGRGTGVNQNLLRLVFDKFIL